MGYGAHSLLDKSLTLHLNSPVEEDREVSGSTRKARVVIQRITLQNKFECKRLEYSEKVPVPAVSPISVLKRVERALMQQDHPLLSFAMVCQLEVQIFLHR